MTYINRRSARYHLGAKERIRELAFKDSEEHQDPIHEATINGSHSRIMVTEEIPYRNRDGLFVIYEWSYIRPSFACTSGRCARIFEKKEPSVQSHRFRLLIDEHGYI